MCVCVCVECRENMVLVIIRSLKGGGGGGKKSRELSREEVLLINGRIHNKGLASCQWQQRGSPWRTLVSGNARRTRTANYTIRSELISLDSLMTSPLPFTHPSSSSPPSLFSPPLPSCFLLLPLPVFSSSPSLFSPPPPPCFLLPSSCFLYLWKPVKE